MPQAGSGIAAQVLKHGLILCLVVANPHLGCAETEAIVTTAVTSDYEFRGETQSANAPAAQLTADVESPIGWHGGLFLSNVNFGSRPRVGNPKLEMNPYVGFTTELSRSVSLDGGINYYAYSAGGGSGYDYSEFYVSTKYKVLRSTLSYTSDYDGNATGAHPPAWYWSAETTTTLHRNLSMDAHIGYSWGPYWTRFGGGSGSDYAIGLDYASKRYRWALQYIGRYSREGEPEKWVSRIVVTVQTQFAM